LTAPAQTNKLEGLSCSVETICVVEAIIRSNRWLNLKFEEANGSGKAVSHKVEKHVGASLAKCIENEYVVIKNNSSLLS